jgi:hypothetical protein
MAPNSVLAPWATVEDLPAGGPCTAATPEIAAWLQVASEILYNFTKRKYPGVGLDVIRPVRPCWAGEYAGTISSHITRGGYHAPRWLRLCSCGCVDSIELPLQPVVDVIEKGCRLPKRVQTVTRQNVTLAVLDPLTLFKDGMTGLAEVDLWVAADARGDATRPAAVLDPMTVARGLVPRRHR